MDAKTEYFSHDDHLAILQQSAPLSQKLRSIHDFIGQFLGFVDRVAVALYDADSDLLKTFLSSDRSGGTPISAYQRPLQESDTLSEIARTGRPRVINDLDAQPSEGSAAERLRDRGYASSYTLPMYHHGHLAGFIFFNSTRRHVFTEHALGQLNMIGHLLALSVTSDLSSINALAASVRTATEFVRTRDFETGAHLERMAHYTRLIAQGIAPVYGLNDEFIEHLFLFAPLHDIGKLAIPDSILLKPGRLDDDEFEVMQRHTLHGADMVDAMITNMGMGELPYIGMLRNIALMHHETLDGSGYPHGLKGDEIPVEARIVSVADIFDALTSQRPYKQAWRNEDAFIELRRLATERLAHDCVEALAARSHDILEIQARCQDSPSV